MKTSITTTAAAKAVTTNDPGMRIFNAETDKEYTGKVKDELLQFIKDNNLHCGAFLTIPQMILHGINFSGCPHVKTFVAVPIETKKNTGNETINVIEKSDGLHAETKTDIKFKRLFVQLYPVELLKFYDNFDIERTLRGRYMNKLKLTKEQIDAIIPTRIKLMDLQKSICIQYSELYAKSECKEVTANSESKQLKEKAVRKSVKKATPKPDEVKIAEPEREIAVDSFKELSEIELNEELRLAIKSSLAFCSKEDFRDYLKCVAFITDDKNILHIVTSEGHVLFDYKTNIKLKNDCWIAVVAKSINEKKLPFYNSTKEFLVDSEIFKGNIPNLLCITNNVKLVEKKEFITNLELLSKVTKIASKFATRRITPCSLTFEETRMIIKPYMNTSFKGELQIILAKCIA